MEKSLNNRLGIRMVRLGLVRWSPGTEITWSHRNRARSQHGADAVGNLQDMQHRNY